MLQLWEQRFTELSSEKHKLLEQYENVEHEEVDEIRKLRKEAAELRVCLADEGTTNDDLYQTLTNLSRQSESANRDYYQLKSQLHDGQQEVNSLDDLIDSLRRQQTADQQERE